MKARLVGDPLQRPSDLVVPSPRKILTQFGVQLGQLSRCPAPRPTYLAGVIVPAQLIVEPNGSIQNILPALGFHANTGCSEQHPRQPFVRVTDRHKGAGDDRRIGATHTPALVKGQ